MPTTTRKKKAAKKLPTQKNNTKAKTIAQSTTQPTISPQRLKVMVSSSVYHMKNEVQQLCAILNTYGYEVLNSDIGTIYPPLNHKDVTLEACLNAVKDCDIFLGVICPFYGTSGYTHLEINEAIRLKKPRRFICHVYVTFARQLLAPLRFTQTKTGKKKPTGFSIPKTGVMDDIRVIDMYEAAVESGKPKTEWGYRWVQEYFHFSEAMRHIEVLFRDRQRVESDFANFNAVNP